MGGAIGRRDGTFEPLTPMPILITATIQALMDMGRALPLDLGDIILTVAITLAVMASEIMALEATDSEDTASEGMDSAGTAAATMSKVA